MEGVIYYVGNELNKKYRCRNTMKLCGFHKECSRGVRNIVTVMTFIVVIAISLPAIGSTISFSTPVLAFNDSSIKMTDQRILVDSHGNLNVVGVVNNLGTFPVRVTVGLNTAVTNVDSSNSPTTSFIKQPIYGKIIYPFTGAPFKFVISPEQVVKGKAFIVDVNKISVPNWNVISLNYSNMPVGKDAALVGTAKNIGSFDLHDVSVYASAHGRNGTQIDSVRSNVIPIIKPGQQIAFIAKPDAAMKSDVFYYSCAGLDLDAPITTLSVGKGQFLPYDLRALARVSDLKYDNATDSINFAITYYSSNGGPLNLKIPQTSETQSVTVMMDGTLNKEASVKMNGKTVFINFFVPPESHNVQIRGVRS
ncbi:MAG TPA: hypothetical protein VJ729_06055 [Nitrososphaeraceae archaeon]|nr:hypothetical protein [Nitrososphaeraceae archaeon]